jgi:class 3 adenylate cyclase
MNVLLAIPDRARRFVRFWASIGSSGYSPRTARRLAVINILSLMVSIMTTPYIVLYAIHDWRGLWVPIVTLSPQVIIYAITPIWHRVGPYAAVVWLSVVWVVFALLYSWYFSRESGLHYYFLPGAAASMLICGPDKLRLSAAISVLSLIGFVIAERLFVTPASFLTIDDGFIDMLFFLTAPFAFLLIFSIVLFAFLEAARAEDALEQAHARSETLLGSLLPQSVADRLKAKPQAVVADSLPSVTILFADIVSFTPRAAGMDPSELLGFLNDTFSKMDVLTAEVGLEKIKTVGDAYMAAGGLTEDRSEDITQRHVQAALDLANKMHRLAKQLSLAGEPVQLRIGLHTGPVLAGVIGAGRLAYDIWGDTVNMAARMEETAPLGCTQVTASVVAAAGPGMAFAERGQIEVKGYGVVRTWLVDQS